MFSTETTVSGAAANGAIPKVEQNWNVIRTKKGTVFIIQKISGCQTEEFLHKINVLLLQHSRKKSLPDSSFLHRSDSSQPPYQPLDPPSGELSKNFSKSHPNDCSCSLTKTIVLEKLMTSIMSVKHPDPRCHQQAQVLEIHQLPPPMKVKTRFVFQM